MKRLLLASTAFLAIAAPAMAADLVRPVAPAPAPVLTAPADSWTGIYVGAFGGYGWSNYGFDLTTTLGPASDSFDIDADGFLGGVAVGADLQLGSSFVLGIMADYYWSGISGSATVTDLFGVLGADLDASIDQKQGWDILGRVGFSGGSIFGAGTSTLFYVLGGWSHLSTDWSYIGAGGLGSSSGSADAEGWTVGVGVESKLTRYLSAKLEYRYTNFDDMDFTFTGPGDGTVSVDPSEHKVLFGLNLRLGL
jgi:outer membrane immunogenic protein